MSFRLLQSRLSEFLQKPIDVSTLATFRILFGWVMIIDAGYLCWHVNRYFPAWEFRPVSPGWEVIDAAVRFPAEYVLFISAVAALGIGLGLWTRWMAALLALTHGYLYLWDATQFNNHNYLIVLLCLWIAVTRLDQDWSLNAILYPRHRSQVVPWWCLGIFLFHIGLVYTYGAINKLNTDWLQGEPVSLWLAVEAHRPVIGSWLAHPWAKYVFAYGGLILDAVITPALCYRKTRPWAIVAACLFHYTNSWLFKIGPFPWLMMASNVLFLEPDTPRRWVTAMIQASGFVPASKRVDSTPAVSILRTPRWVTVGLLAYVMLQVLLPWRFLFYSGNPEWTEEAKNFSWRMMLSHKDTFLGVLVADLATGQVWEVDVRDHLSRRQMRGKGVWGHPRHMASYARFLRREALRRGFQDPYVKVDAIASLNGRPYQYLVDPDVDLGTAPVSWWLTPEWIVPLKSRQPIGDYGFMDQSVKYARVMEVIEKHRQQLQVPAAQLSSSSQTTNRPQH
ncbi:hypothetical protein GC163_22770 [bacterium]|nr:hypothetical protein [bacterium]